MTTTLFFVAFIGAFLGYFLAAWCLATTTRLWWQYRLERRRKGLQEITQIAQEEGTYD